MLTFPQILIMN